MWLSDPGEARLQEALSVRCVVCRAPKGVLCVNIVAPGEPLPSRLVHIGRTETIGMPRKAVQKPRTATKAGS